MHSDQHAIDRFHRAPGGQAQHQATDCARNSLAMMRATKTRGAVLIWDG